MEVRGLNSTDGAEMDTVRGDGGGKADGEAKINDLGGMVRKKKRKVEDGEEQRQQVDGSSQGLEEEQQPPVNVLGAGMVRKKAKPAS